MAPRTWRVPIDGSASAELLAEPAWIWQALTATAVARIDEQGVVIRSLTDETVQTLPGATGLVSDGITLQAAVAGRPGTVRPWTPAASGSSQPTGRLRLPAPGLPGELLGEPCG